MGGFGRKGLELTMAVSPSSASASASGSEGGGCNNNNNNNNNMRDLDINLPASEEVDEVESDSSNQRGKKLRLTKEQARLLEESFRHNHTLNPKEKEALASRLRLKARQVEVWFQNRRARTKLKQTELECEYLKRCFGSLSEENRRLQREVEELRAMRVAPPTVLSPQTRLPMPASALTMCPRCQRVTTAAVATAPSQPRGGRAAFHPQQPSAAY